MKKSAIYVRVSTTHQIDKDSLPLQKNDMINYSKFILGIEEYEIFEDAGFSGKNTDRPAFQEMFKRIKQGEFSHLLVWKIDRISRNLLDFCSMYDELKRYNCTFISKNEQFDTSTAMGEAMLKIILVFAELERKLTGERVTSVMLDRASKGLWNGAPIPLGYKWDKNIKFPVIDDEEKNTVEIIYDTYLKSESSSAVTKLLNTSGIKTKKDGRWTTKTICDVIRNPFYKGTYRYNYRVPGHGKIKDENEWIVIPNNHDAIINEKLWDECNKIMDLNANKNSARFRRTSKVHIFAGLLECGECNNSFYAKSDKTSLDGYTPSLYTCSGRYNHLGCGQKTISDTIIGNFTLNFISNMIKISKSKKKINAEELESKLLKGNCFKDIVGIEEIKDIYNSIFHSQSNTFKPAKKSDFNSPITNIDSNNLESELKKQQRALDRLEDLYLFEDNDMSKKDYFLKKNKITDKIKELNKKINETQSIDASVYNFKFFLDVTTLELSTKLIEGNIKVKELIQNVGRELIKDFINNLIDKIIVKDRQVLSLQFKNGLNVTFIYNS